MPEAESRQVVHDEIDGSKLEVWVVHVYQSHVALGVPVHQSNIPDWKTSLQKARKKRRHMGGAPSVTCLYYECVDDVVWMWVETCLDMDKYLVDIFKWRLISVGMNGMLGLPFPPLTFLSISSDCFGSASLVGCA